MSKKAVKACGCPIGTNCFCYVPDPKAEWIRKNKLFEFNLLSQEIPFL